MAAEKILFFFLLVLSFQGSLFGGELSTSSLIELPNPIYDIKTSGGTLLVLASTKEGARFADSPPPAIYKVDMGSGDIKGVLNFPEDCFPTQMFTGCVPCDHVFLFNNTRGSAFFVNVLDHEIDKYRAFPIKKNLDFISCNTNKSLVLYSDVEGVLSLWKIDRVKCANSDYTVAELSRHESGYFHLDSIVPMYDAVFAVSSGVDIQVVNMNKPQPHILKQKHVEIIPALSGFRYPHRLIGYRDGKIYFRNGPSAIGVLDTRDWSHTDYPMQISSVITHGSLLEDEFLLGCLDGTVLSLSIIDLSLNWSGRVAPGPIRTVIRINNNQYVAGDRYGNVVKLVVKK